MNYPGQPGAPPYSVAPPLPPTAPTTPTPEEQPWQQSQHPAAPQNQPQPPQQQHHHHFALAPTVAPFGPQSVPPVPASVQPQPPSMQPQSMQPYPSAYPSAPPPHQQQYAHAQQHFVKQPSRNVGMIVGGAVLLVIALAASIFFVINLHQYLTISDRWANDPMMSHNTEWIVELIKRAALKRMMVFGSVMSIFGIGGLVVGGLGLRKK